MGRALAEMVINDLPEGTLVRVSGDMDEKFVPLIKSQLSMQFDVVVDEAPSSVNQQERVWAVLQQLIPQLLQAQMPIPKEVVDYAPLPADLQMAWKQAMQQDPMQEQAKQQQVIESIRGLKAENAQKESAAKLNDAKAQQILSEMATNPSQDRARELEQELFKTQIEAKIDERVAQFKANREAETKLLIEQMKIESNERIKTMEQAIDSRLERSRMESDRQSKVAVASIAAAARGKEPPTEDELDAEEAKPDPQALMADALRQLSESLAQSGRKPRGYKVVRDKMGDMERVDLDWGDDGT
jgi:hypothetical protein